MAALRTSGCRGVRVTPAILVDLNIGKLGMTTVTPATGIFTGPENTVGAVLTFLVAGAVGGGGIVHVAQCMAVFSVRLGGVGVG